MRNTKVSLLLALAILAVLVLLTLSLGARPVFAATSSPADCKQWEIKIVPAKGGPVDAGWEPISDALYGAEGEYGVLLRRCAR